MGLNIVVNLYSENNQKQKGKFLKVKKLSSENGSSHRIEFFVVVITVYLKTVNCPKHELARQINALKDFHTIQRYLQGISKSNNSIIIYIIL